MYTHENLPVITLEHAKALSLFAKPSRYEAGFILLPFDPIVPRHALSLSMFVVRRTRRAKKSYMQRQNVTLQNPFGKLKPRTIYAADGADYLVAYIPWPDKQLIHVAAFASKREAVSQLRHLARLPESVLTKALGIHDE